MANVVLNPLFAEEFTNSAGFDEWLRKAIERIIFLCQLRNLDLLLFAKEENPHDLRNANEKRVILCEYVTLLNHMGCNLEFAVNFDTTCYNAFTIANAKTGEIVFECNEL